MQEASLAFLFLEGPLLKEFLQNFGNVLKVFWSATAGDSDVVAYHILSHPGVDRQERDLEMVPEPSQRVSTCIGVDYPSDPQRF